MLDAIENDIIARGISGDITVIGADINTYVAIDVRKCKNTPMTALYNKIYYLRLCEIPRILSANFPNYYREFIAGATTYFISSEYIIAYDKTLTFYEIIDNPRISIIYYIENRAHIKYIYYPDDVIVEYNWRIRKSSLMLLREITLIRDILGNICDIFIAITR
jgi:hypothetical protein